MKKLGKRQKIILGVVVVIAILIFVVTKFQFTGKGVSGGGGQQVEIVHLTEQEQVKVAGILMSSKFIEDVPKKNPILLRFYSFENAQRIWRDGFLIGQNQLLTTGTPTIYLSLDAKYISEFNENNLCEVIKRAKQNGDLGFYSESGKVSLLIKYASMLKHRECFGF